MIGSLATKRQNESTLSQELKSHSYQLNQSFPLPGSVMIMTTTLSDHNDQIPLTSEAAAHSGKVNSLFQKNEKAYEHLQVYTEGGK